MRATRVCLSWDGTVLVIDMEWPDQPRSILRKRHGVQIANRQGLYQ